MKFAASFSGGKDSLLAIKRMICHGNRLLALIVSQNTDEVSWTHGLGRKYFEELAEVFKCELINVFTDVEHYEERFEEGMKRAKEIGAEAVVFGDIDIAQHIRWNMDRCKNVGIECIHPLMFEDRKKVASEFINSKILANIVKVDEKKLPSSFIGRRYDADIIEELKKYKNVDICGENGEFHTMVDVKSIEKYFEAVISNRECRSNL